MPVNTRYYYTELFYAYDVSLVVRIKIKTTSHDRFRPNIAKYTERYVYKDEALSLFVNDYVRIIQGNKS